MAFDQTPKGADVNTRMTSLYDEETGAIGYILLWLMGVPGIVLFAIFLLRGCD